MRPTFLGAALVGFATVASAQSAIIGRVHEDGRPVEGAEIYGVRSDRSIVRQGITDAMGHFRLAPLSAGLYTVTGRKVGYRSAEQHAVRVAEGETVSLNVSLAQSPRQLSTIFVVTSPTSIDLGTPEMRLRLDRELTEYLPTARDASALKEAGLRFRNDMEVGPGGKQIQLEDPDGNAIELFEPAR